MYIPKTRTLIVREGTARGHKINSPSTTARLICTKESHGLTWEEMWVIGVDGQSHATFYETVARGGAHGLAVTAQEVLFRVCRHNASAFLLAHNHPSGSPAPSNEDRKMTKALAQASAIVGPKLLDHVIVTDDPMNYFSFLESEPGWLQA